MKKNDWRTQLSQSLQAVHWPTVGKEMAEQSWSIGRWLLLAFLLQNFIRDIQLVGLQENAIKQITSSIYGNWHDRFQFLAIQTGISR